MVENDPDFSESDTQAAAEARRQALITAFLRGSEAFQPGSARQINQVHLNVERCRSVEPLFQPSLVALEQGGLVELIHHVINSVAVDDRPLISSVCSVF